MPTESIHIHSTEVDSAASCSASSAAAVEPLLIADTVAAALCGISRSHLHKLRAAGKWGPEVTKLGRKRLFNREEVIAWARSGCPDAATWAAMRAAAKRGGRPR